MTDYKGFIASLKQKIADDEQLSVDSICGCSEHEIELIRLGQNVPRLPELYRQLMLQMGYGIQRFQGTLIWNYPAILKFEAVNADALGDNLFQFGQDDQGAGFFFFRYYGSDDPPVLVLWAEEDEMKICDESLTGFLTSYFVSGS